MDESVRQLVRNRAEHRCEYCCLLQRHLPFSTFQIEHIRPKKHGGSDDPANLAELAEVDANRIGERPCTRTILSAAGARRTHGGRLGHVCGTAPGFSASLPQAAIDALREDPRIKAVVADTPAFLDAQTLPTGVDRIDADENTFAAIDGVPGIENNGLPFPFYVATIDSGVDLTRENLRHPTFLRKLRDLGDRTSWLS